MIRINLKRAVRHVPHGQIHGIAFEPGEQDVHPKDAETFIREGWADPLSPAPADEGAGTTANGQAPTPDPAAPSPDSGPVAPSSASRAAPASPKRRRKPAAKRKPSAKPA